MPDDSGRPNLSDVAAARPAARRAMIIGTVVDLPAPDQNDAFYVGEGPPSPSAGREGDRYLDLEAAAWWGPKTADGWPVAPAIVLGDYATNRLDALEASQAGGRVLKRASIEANSVHNASFTNGLTVVSEGTLPLRLLGVDVGEVGGSLLVDCSYVTVEAAGGVVDNGSWVVYVQWSPAGAETWSILGAASGTVAGSGAGGRGRLCRTLPFNRAPGLYDFRVIMQSLNNAHSITLHADDGTLLGPAFLLFRED